MPSLTGENFHLFQAYIERHIEQFVGQGEYNGYNLSLRFDQSQSFFEQVLLEPASKFYNVNTYKRLEKQIEFLAQVKVPVKIKLGYDEMDLTAANMKYKLAKGLRQHFNQVILEKRKDHSIAIENLKTLAKLFSTTPYVFKKIMEADGDTCTWRCLLLLHSRRVKLVKFPPIDRVTVNSFDPDIFQERTKCAA